jgi:hypothetical protein
MRFNAYIEFGQSFNKYMLMKFSFCTIVIIEINYLNVGKGESYEFLYRYV